jgi:hypothetical protein
MYSQSKQTSGFDTAILAEVHQIPHEHQERLLDIIRLFREGLALPKAEASLRAGWEEALQNETEPVSTLWEDIDAE